MKRRVKELSALLAISGESKDVARQIFFGLFTLQHRGQEESGISVSDKKIETLKKPGLVTEIEEEEIENLRGDSGIGFNLSSATHFIAQEDWVLAYDGKFWENLKGLGSVLILEKKRILAFKDPLGLRPLCLGKLPSGEYLISSESCAIESLGGVLIRELDPGEKLSLKKGKVYSLDSGRGKTRAFCLFEFISFTRPDSYLFERPVHQVKTRMGEILAERTRDIWKGFQGNIGPVPRAANQIAIGFCQRAGKPYRTIFIQNRYIDRLLPPRLFRYQSELNPLSEAVENENIILIDEAIVYGEAARARISLLKEAKAKEIFLLIASPAVKYSCPFGIGQEGKRPIAYQKSEEEIREYLGVDFLYYLSLEDLLRAIGLPRDFFCLYCLNGENPLERV